MELKYVVTRHGNFAIFPKLTNHSDIANALWGEASGAGFCRFVNGKIECYGKSISLSTTDANGYKTPLLSNGQIDEDIINRQLFENEYD